MRHLWELMMRSAWKFCLSLAVLGLGAVESWAQAPRVLPVGTKPADARLKPQRTLNDKFHPWVPPASKEAWEAEATRIRQQLLVSLGMWPMWEKTELQPVVTGTLDRGDYTVDKVYFASRSGHYVSGVVYRPKNAKGQIPAVLCPHGHWAEGRFYDAGEKGAADQLATGAEDFLSGARSPLQARFVQLARMGCLVFHYDMVGNADSQVIEHRTQFNDVAASLRLQNKMGLQTWNSIRAVDYVLSLPEVDPARIGVTGASGGGTQTFMLCALDPRPAAAFPAVMVGTAMQGGCQCENADYLRVGINNVAIAGLMAPRPLGMVGADDWTIDIETRGLPELKQVYGYYGVSDHVAAKTYSQFPHNYNQWSRELMYRWFAKHLKLAPDAPVNQLDFWPLTREQLTVYTEKHPVPADALKADALRQKMAEESDAAWAALLPKTKADLAKYKESIRPVLGVLLDRGLPVEEEVITDDVDTKDVNDLKVLTARIGRKSEGTQLPIVSVYHEDRFDGRVAIWIDGAGKSALFEASGQPTPAVRQLAMAGFAVTSVDQFLTGEFLNEGESPVYKVEEGFPAYTYCYNRPLLAHRVRDVLTLIRTSTLHPDVKSVHLVGTGDGGLIALLARSTFDGAVGKCLVDLNGFAFSSVSAVSDPRLLPGAVKYGGVGGLTITAAEGETAIYGATDANKSELGVWTSLQPAALHAEVLTPDMVAEQLLK
jgi:hypothetical protein